MQATAGNQAVQQALQQHGDRAEAGKPGKPEILRYGSRGESVKRLQEALNRYGGLGELKVDGIFGPRTRDAVREFQKTHPPLDVDNRVGPETWAELERVGDEGAPLPGATAKDFLAKGRKLYGQGKYALAYDEFAKAYQLDPDKAYLYNMAQSLRLTGGRREDAIRLFQQFIAASSDDDAVARAQEEVDKLRGPSPTGDQAKNQAAADELIVAARKFFADGEYGQAYDEFTKAWDLTHEPTLLYNRASSLRAMGGQRGQAMALLQEFLTKDVSEDRKAAARQEIIEIKGPGKSGDEAKDKDAQQELYVDAQVAYTAEDFLLAYDLFSKAYEVAHDPAFLWNRAQCLRLQGGRAEEAIKLDQQFASLDLPEEIKRAARVHIAELKGPDKKTGAALPH